VSEQATILIPDISGYTEFITTTEVNHSSHIINELLEVIVASNDSGLIVGEIEGDAVLFYKRGEPIIGSDLVRQCLTMFEHFHLRLKVIERDALCDCGACSGVSKLSLKFIAHHGPVTEIKVAQFAKPAGIELIVAHRLMKNTIGSTEYILVTKPFFEHLGASGTAINPSFSLRWEEGSDEYPAIGKVSYRYAHLADVRRTVPDIPPRIDIPYPDDHDPASTVQVSISATLAEVYGKLTDAELLKQWVTGLINVEEDPITHRIGKKHVCIFDKISLEISPKSQTNRDDELTFVDEVRIPAMGLNLNGHWKLSRMATHDTQVHYTVRSESGGLMPPEVLAQLIPGMRTDLDRFKSLCESGSH